MPKLKPTWPRKRKTARVHGVSPVEDRPILSATKSSPKNLVLVMYRLWRY